MSQITFRHVLAVPFHVTLYMQILMDVRRFLWNAWTSYLAVHISLMRFILTWRQSRRQLLMTKPIEPGRQAVPHEKCELKCHSIETCARISFRRYRHINVVHNYFQDASVADPGIEDWLIGLSAYVIQPCIFIEPRPVLCFFFPSCTAWVLQRLMSTLPLRCLRP